MSERWCLLNSSPRERTEDELRRLYGAGALITRMGRYNLIHLDAPSPEEIAKRVSEFDPDDLFEDDCPLCRMLREEHCDVIYDGAFGDEGEDDEGWD